MRPVAALTIPQYRQNIATYRILLHDRASPVFCQWDASGCDGFLWYMVVCGLLLGRMLPWYMPTSIRPVLRFPIVRVCCTLLSCFLELDDAPEIAALGASSVKILKNEEYVSARNRVPFRRFPFFAQHFENIFLKCALSYTCGMFLSLLASFIHQHSMLPSQYLYMENKTRARSNFCEHALVRHFVEGTMVNEKTVLSCGVAFDVLPRQRSWFCDPCKGACTDTQLSCLWNFVIFLVTVLLSYRRFEWTTAVNGFYQEL